MTIGPVLRVAAIAICLQIAVVASGTGASADSWSAPVQRTFQSPNRRFIFVAVPSGGEFETAGLRLSQDDLAEIRAMDRKAARGFLCRISPGGACKTVWRTLLENTVSPVSALVSDSGHLVITFDEWGRVGYRHAVVVYGRDGKLKRSYELSDILRWDQLLRVPTSVSSRWWSVEYQHKLSPDEQELILRINVSPFLSPDSPEYITRKLKLPAN